VCYIIKNLRWAQWLHPVIPATQEVEIGTISVQGQPHKKVHKIHLNKKLGVAVYTYHSSNEGIVSRRVKVQSNLFKKMGDPI
jgi:hypothetical protein